MIESRSLAAGVVDLDQCNYVRNASRLLRVEGKPGRMAMDAMRLMQDGGFRHGPVVDRGRVVGVMSWGDFRPSEHDRPDVETTYWERI